MPYRITFESRGLEPLRRRARGGPTRVKITLNEGLRQIGRVIVPSKGIGPLASATPKRTGKLARSTFFRITGGTKDQTLTVMQPAKTADGAFYGQFVREGTRPHIIRARNAEYLHWVNADGDDVFRKEVMHPGTKPNPYHIKAFRQLRPQIQMIVNQMGRKVAAYLGGK